MVDVVNSYCHGAVLPPGKCPPDHGDGRLEAALLLVLVVIITGIVLAFFYKRHDRN
jgi:hypothetical protein